MLCACSMASLYLPISPLYLPISPCISLYLPGQVLGEAGMLRHCLERLLQTQDVLLLKLLREI